LVSVGRLRAAEGAAYHREYLATRAKDYGVDVLQRLQEGAAVSMFEYARWKRRQVELTRALELYFGDMDLLVTPTTRIAAPRFDDAEGAVGMAQHLTAFTVPFNLTGFPAISIPGGFTREGLPIGIQFIALPWHEALLLQVAHQYQLVTDWHTRQPHV
jgi:Asp-tRNA(Asn)/Glu-tRNA(Gln) amidotransferase A subunit family amidase